jgi:hypothetical protein
MSLGEIPLLEIGCVFINARTKVRFPAHRHSCPQMQRIAEIGLVSISAGFPVANILLLDCL